MRNTDERPSLPSDEQHDLEIPLQLENPRRKTAVRVTAFILAAVFLLFIANSILPLIGLPTLDFIVESSELMRDPKVKGYLSAIVAVSANQKYGTGFNIDPDGLIVTNSHVIENSSVINLQGLPGDDFPVLDWQVYPDSDLALIDLEMSEMSFLPLAEGNQEHADSQVIVIGNPLGFFRIVSQASVLGYTRLSGIASPVLMIKGSIYKGHSGSPVINKDGQVIGIVFAINADESEAETIAFAIPASEIMRIRDAYTADKTP